MEKNKFWNIRIKYIFRYSRELIFYQCPVFALWVSRWLLRHSQTMLYRNRSVTWHCQQRSLSRSQNKTSESHDWEGIWKETLVASVEDLSRGSFGWSCMILIEYADVIDGIERGTSVNMATTRFLPFATKQMATVFFRVVAQFSVFLPARLRPSGPKIWWSSLRNDSLAVSAVCKHQNTYRYKRQPPVQIVL